MNDLYVLISILFLVLCVLIIVVVIKNRRIAVLNNELSNWRSYNSDMIKNHIKREETHVNNNAKLEAQLRNVRKAVNPKDYK